MSVLLRHEAPPHRDDFCNCGSGEKAHYLCNNCHGAGSYCAQCILNRHRNIPLHRIKKWNGLFLENVSLKSLGLVTYFGHGGSACPKAEGASTLSILHIDGFHFILASFCRCSSAWTHDLQLFDGKLFSASLLLPKSAFTFELLDHFRINHLEGKISAYTYVQSLYRLTDDEGALDLPVS